MKIKKFLAGFLSAMMVISLLPSTAFATEIDTSDNGSGGESVVAEHEHDFETNAPVLSEDGTTLIYTCAVEGCDETYEEEYVPDTPTVMNDGDSNSGDGSNTVEAEGCVAQIGDGDNAKTFATLQEAIESAGNTETSIILLSNITEDITISSGQNITLNLGEYTLTNLSANTITNSGTLTIVGSGTVESVVSGKGALINYGTANLQGGAFCRDDANLEKSYYTVINQGTMTVNGAEISNTGTEASCLENGWYNDDDVTGNAELTVISGKISGGLNALKNDAGGVLDIRGGEITNSTQYAIMNWNQATISGGEITCTAKQSGSVYPAAIYNQAGENTSTSEGKLTISGGNITTVESSTYALDNRAEATISGTANLTGGSSAVQSTGSASITTISGGTLVGTKYYAVTASDHSIVEITGGIFNGKYYVVRTGVNSNVKITIADGTFTNTAGTATVYVGSGTEVDINGGVFSGSKKYAVNNNGGQLTISGGEFESLDSAVYVNGTNSAVTTISGGKFTTTDNSKAVVTVKANGTLTVSGGAFSGKVSEEYLAEGYIYNSEDGTITSLGVASITDNDGNIKYYETLQAAIDESSEGQIVKLVVNTAEDIIIASGKNITLDLNGKKLTNVSGHTITNNGTLTIMDSSAGAVGTVDNVTHAKAAIYNTENATCTILAGKFTRSKENGQSGEDNGGNSFYTINNYGTMTIGSKGEENDITVTANGHYSSLVHNGWQSSKDAVDKEAKMTIYSGTFTGGINTIKNDESGYLTITGGTFTNVTQYALQNWNVAEISGGTFESNTMSAVYNGADAVTSVGKLTITGGTFTAPDDYYVVYNDTDTVAEVEITGGTYSSQYYTNKNSALNYTSEENTDGTYGVVPCNETNSVASVTVDGKTTYYPTLENAIEAVQPGETITLLEDVTLADNTPVKIMDKGTEKSPIILDLNGHTISGSNNKNGTTESTPGGILWINGSYATLTDSSEGEKGSIINTYVGSSNAYGLVIKSTSNNVGAVTISGGVEIDVTGSTSTSSRAIHFQNNTNISGTLTLNIEDAKVTANKGHTVYASAGSGYSCMVTINGGEFESTSKANNATTLSGSAATVTIKGGTFHNWLNTDWNEVAKDHTICIAQTAKEDAFTVTIAEQEPADYVALVDATDVYRAICLTEGSDLYLLHNIQTPAGRTIHVKKNVAYTFPAGSYYGNKTSNDPEIYKLTLDLEQDVTLSGGMNLYSADITVTGAGTLADGFAWTPADGYGMTAKGEEGGLYSCRLTTGAGAELIKEDGTSILYSNVVGAINAAKLNQGSTVKMLADYTNSLQVLLGLYNKVIADITLDLNGHTYTYSGASDAITVNDGAKLTLTNSSKEQTGVLATKGSRETFIANSALATTGSGGTIIIEEGVTVENLVLLDAPGSKLTVAGTIDTTGFKTYAISGNGSTGKGDTEIIIKETAEIISDPAVAAPAIYHPQSGTLTIEGGTITGYGGIQMCSGNLIISGDPTITATGSDVTEEKTGDGGIPDGAAISIVNRSYPGGMPTLTITGNPTVTAAVGNDSVQAYTWSNNTESDWSEAGDSINISGGYFSNGVPAEYCAEGYVPTTEAENGMYTVELSNDVAKVYGCSLTLDGTIGVNFYLLLPEEVTSDADAYLSFAFAGQSGENTVVKISEAQKVTDTADTSITYYKVTYRVVAKEMTDTIMLQLFDGAGNAITLFNNNGENVTEGFEYSVEKYATSYLGTNASGNLAELMKAMLNYGGYAQQHFVYETDTLANAGFEYSEEELNAVTADVVKDHEKVTSETELNGLSYYGTSLMLESDTGIRHYFTLEGESIEDYTFSVNIGGEACTLTAQQKGNYYYVEIGNIAAVDLDTKYVLTVTDDSGAEWTITYSALSYVYTVLSSSSTSEALQNTMKALYLYNEAADIYFESISN